MNDKVIKIMCPKCKKDSGYFHNQFKDIVLAYSVRCKLCNAVVIKVIDV